jgi:ribosomal protein S18 acetylase RimI-like enzyme
MSAKTTIIFREATLQEDSLIAEHFYQMWLDNNVSPESIQPDWLNINLQFISKVRQDLCYKAFVAEVDGKLVGSVGCQLFAGLYPNIILGNYRKYGYIWGVYVYPNYRRQGLAEQLTKMAIAYLKSIDCTRVVLHASPQGKPIYSKLGFSDTNEMRLDISYD